MRPLYKGMQNPDKSLLIVGTEEEAAGIQSELGGQGVVPRIRVISPDTLPDSLQEPDNVGAVCCASSAVKLADLPGLALFCKERHAELFFCVPEMAVLQKNMRVRNIGFLSFLSLVEEPLSHWWNRGLKRLSDLLVSGAFLLVFFPVIYIVAAIAIKRRSAGPVFSLIKETGRGGKRFNRMVFRAADFPEGSFIQKPGVRLLPQFLNVFMGRMSIVGLHLSEGTAESLPSSYTFAKPGMVNCGFCKNADVWYTQNWSLWMDIRILLKALLNRNKIN